MEERKNGERRMKGRKKWAPERGETYEGSKEMGWKRVKGRKKLGETYDGEERNGGDV